MKFSNEEAFEKLKGMLTNDGKKPLRMSEISLKKQIETLLPLLAADETELVDFATKVIPSLEVMNSNAEFDNSSNYKKLKEEFEKKFGNETKKTEENNNGGKKDENTALIERLAAIEAQLAEAKKEKSLGEIRSRISNGLTSKGVKSKEWIDAIMSEISVSEETDVDAKVDSLLKLYNKSKADVDYDVTPSGSGSSSGSGNKAFDNFLDEFKKDREAEIERTKQMI